jgi:predicted Zn-dependent protease
MMCLAGFRSQLTKEFIMRFHKLAVRLIVFAGLVALPAAWDASILASEPFTLTSVEQENKLGEETYQEILQKEKVNKDPVINAFVQRIAKRIAAAAPDKGFQYEVSVLDSPQVNAFCLPGGKICVYTGILPYCENEAALACVMGHEVAHAILRHGGQRMTQGAIVGVLGQGLEKVLEIQQVGGTTSTITKGVYNYGTQLGILLPYSRTHEVDADEAGLMYMARAGYDPREGARFWQRFSVLKSSVPAFLSTHPAHDDRVQRLEKLTNKALLEYLNAPDQYGLGERIPAKYLVAPVEVAQQTAAQPAATAPKAATGTQTPAVAAPTQPAVTTSSVLSPLTKMAEKEVRQGLQQALSQGFQSAIKTLGKQDGFFKDELVKVVMPKQMGQLEQVARLFGQGKYVDDFVLQMNRAAETAMPATADVLAQAVASLTIDDAKAIVGGAQPDAATQFFTRTAGDNLRQRILPIVQGATAKTGATAAYKDLLKKAGFAAKALAGDFDLDSYVTDKALAGLYVKMADEEKRIRANPAGQASDLLRKVFGAVVK